MMIKSIRDRFTRLNANPLTGWLITIEAIALSWIMATRLSGGDDLFRFYYKIAWGCPECSYLPWYASWIFFPLRFVPAEIAWPLMMALTLLVVLYATQKFNVSMLVVVLSFPLISQLWLGQVDWLIIAGLLLAFFAPSPWLRGAGIVLASLKPQITLAAIPLALWYDRERWKTVLVPIVVVAASLLVWGIDWPIRWWLIREQRFDLTAWVAAPLAYNPLPYLSIFVVREKQQKLAAALLSAALTIPAFGVYSYVTFLVTLAPWWAIPLSYAWALGYPFMGNLSLRLAWVLPLGLLAFLVWPSARTWWANYRVQRSARPATSPQP